MNIIEAVKGGKRFRRKGWVTKGNPDWWTPVGDFGQFKTSLEDVLADDWEVEVLPVSITQEDFQAAWKRAVKKAGGTDIVYNGFCQFSYLVAKELGL